VLVLFWQTLIAISLICVFAISYRYSKNNKSKETNVGKLISNLPALSMIGWIIWSLFAIGGTLLNFQLGLIVVIGFLGYAITFSLRNKDKEVSKLKDALSDATSLKNRNFDEAILKEKASIDANKNDYVSKIYPINGVDNLKSELNFALLNAHSRILIMSGWASKYVIDDQFISNCLRQLSNGVEIHIGFGYDTSSAQRKPEWERRGKKQLSSLMLKALENSTEHLLFIYEFDNHYKSLVKDEEYFITGSINWLSNSKGRNFERAWKNEFPELAKREFQDCLDIMKPQKLTLRRSMLKPFLEWDNQ